MRNTGWITANTLIGKSNHKITVTDTAWEEHRNDIDITFKHDDDKILILHGFLGKDEIGASAHLLAYEKEIDVNDIEIFIHCKGEKPWEVIEDAQSNMDNA